MLFFSCLVFAGETFFEKKVSPTPPSKKLCTIYPGFGVCFFGFCEGNFFGKKSPSRSLQKTFILYSKGLDSADRTQKNPTVPRSPKLYPAISPRRRRMLPQPLANDLLRKRIAHIGEQSDLHKLYPSPSPYKSFAELFQKRPFPRSPRPSVYSLRVDPAQ